MGGRDLQYGLAAGLFGGVRRRPGYGAPAGRYQRREDRAHFGRRGFAGIQVAKAPGGAPVASAGQEGRRPDRVRRSAHGEHDHTVGRGWRLFGVSTSSAMPRILPSAYGLQMGRSPAGDPGYWV